MAHTDAPTPLPQIATPRSTFLRGYGQRERDDVVGIVIALAQAMSAEIDDLMSRSAKLAEQFFLQTKSTMIGGNSNAHIVPPCGNLR